MRNDNALAPEPRPSPPVQLRSIWHVDADHRYEVTRASSTTTAGRLLCVRTVTGNGRLVIGEETVTVSTASVLLVDPAGLTRYRCDGTRWHFWWFECLSPPGPARPELSTHPWTPQEEADHRRAYRALQRLDDRERILASGLLAAWICRWRAVAPSLAGTPHQTAVDAVINAMHERLDGGLTLRDLCRIAGLGERRLRQCFHARTGSSPKRFYLDLRLAYAREALHARPQPLAPLAEQLGFSSPYHLSRAYRRHFGNPPSRDNG